MPCLCLVWQCHDIGGSQEKIWSLFNLDYQEQQQVFSSEGTPSNSSSKVWNKTC